jgi:hypothetical protein
VNVYPFIEAEKSQRRNVKWACALLKVSRSAFYADRAAGPSKRERDDAELTDAIVAVHEESDGTYEAASNYCVSDSQQEVSNVYALTVAAHW